MTHNLPTILLCTLDASGLREEKIARREVKHVQEQSAERRSPARAMVRHASQLTCQFIRLVRYYLEYKTPWLAALPHFQRRLEVYL